jgi:hypothetical protein
MVVICAIWLASATVITVHPREADKENKIASTNRLAASDVTLSLTCSHSILCNCYLASQAFPHTPALAKVHFSPTTTHLLRKQ